MKTILAIVLVVTISLTTLSIWSEHYGYEKAKTECEKAHK